MKYTLDDNMLRLFELRGFLNVNRENALILEKISKIKESKYIFREKILPKKIVSALFTKIKKLFTNNESLILSVVNRNRSK